MGSRFNVEISSREGGRVTWVVRLTAGRRYRGTEEDRSWLFRETEAFQTQQAEDKNLGEGEKRWQPRPFRQDDFAHVSGRRWLAILRFRVRQGAEGGH